MPKVKVDPKHKSKIKIDQKTKCSTLNYEMLGGNLEEALVWTKTFWITFPKHRQQKQ